jgi:RNA polymerase sigma-70 factor (ECF subfamily)
LISDEELMRLVQGGDESALGALIERWELPVKRTIARMILNASEAEELCQETFIRVWQARGAFRGGSAFRPWLFSIALNLARNRLRWWRRRPHVALDEWEELPGQGDSGRRSLERRERTDAVRRAVADLPRDQREAIVLFEYEELSHAEIAAAVGASVKAVEARLYRARAALRAALKASMIPGS